VLAFGVLVFDVLAFDVLALDAETLDVEPVIAESFEGAALCGEERLEGGKGGCPE
jgi:hypothetical protein